MNVETEFATPRTRGVANEIQFGLVAKPVEFRDVKAEYASLWGSMVLKKGAAFQATAKRLMKGMTRYKDITAATGVPAVLIAILHDRESGGNFGTYLGNGQSLKRVTTIVPKGRGPFKSFEEGAIDALKIDGLSAIKNWSIEQMLFRAEGFNGFGYRLFRRIRSPYLWGGTNHQQKGKYVSDGVYDANVMDPQLGAAGVLAAMMDLDPSLKVPLAKDLSAIPAKPVVVGGAGAVVTGALLSFDWRLAAAVVIAATIGFVAFKLWKK